MSKAMTVVAVKEIIYNAKVVLKKRQLPNHNAFTISEVIGAVTGLPKEFVLDEMLKVDID